MAALSMATAAAKRALTDDWKINGADDSTHEIAIANDKYAIEYQRH